MTPQTNKLPTLPEALKPTPQLLKEARERIDARLDYTIRNDKGKWSPVYVPGWLKTLGWTAVATVGLLYLVPFLIRITPLVIGAFWAVARWWGA